MVEEGHKLLGIYWVAAVGLLFSTILSLWLVWGVLRSGRL